MSKILAVHFLTEDMTPKIGGGKPWIVGETRSVRGKLVLCQHGFHYCHTWTDALLGNYLYGPNACVVEVEDDGPKDEHKGCSPTRGLVHVVNVEREMRLFAVDEASRALKAWEKSSGKVADIRSWQAVKAARAFANGRLSAAELSAAYSAAYLAAESAADWAYSAAYLAAESAADWAYSAAYSAAESAAGWAAYSAAYSAAESAADWAYSAAYSAAESAAGWAAYLAAESAAMSASAARFAAVMGKTTGYWDEVVV